MKREIERERERERERDRERERAGERVRERDGEGAERVRWTGRVWHSCSSFPLARLGLFAA
jgi:hypothetical protein